MGGALNLNTNAKSNTYFMKLTENQLKERHGEKVQELERQLRDKDVILETYRREHGKLEISFDKTINLTLYNQHYELTEPKPRVIEREDLKHFANRRIVLYNASDKKVKTIQKTKEGFLIEETDDKKEIDELQRRQIKHVIWLCNVHREPTEELWNQFNVFEQYCRNEFKTSFTQYESLPHFAVALWKSTLPAISLTSPTVYDDFMLDDIMHSGGALVDFVEGEYENATAYDYVSFYPSLNLGNVPRMMPYYGEPSYKYMKPCNDEEKEIS